MTTSKLKINWENLTEHGIQQVRSYLLGEHCNKEERLSEDRRELAVKEIIDGFWKTPKKRELFCMMMANITAFPVKYKLDIWVEIIKLYTKEPKAYAEIIADPFIIDRLYIIDSVIRPERNPDIENSELYKKMIEAKDYSGLDLRVIDEKDPRDLKNRIGLGFTFYFVSDIEGKRIFLGFTRRSQDYNEQLFVDVVSDEIEDINLQRKLEEAVSLSTLKYKREIFPPHGWSYLDVGPLITKKVKSNYGHLPLIRK